MHFAFVPVTEDKRGGEKVSAKEVITKNDLKTFHTDLERHLDSFEIGTLRWSMKPPRTAIRRLPS